MVTNLVFVKSLLSIVPVVDTYFNVTVTVSPSGTFISFPSLSTSFRLCTKSSPSLTDTFSLITTYTVSSSPYPFGSVGFVGFSVSLFAGLSVIVDVTVLFPSSTFTLS